MAAPAVEATAATALRSVALRARKAAERVGRDPERVRVVAVSKTKPVSLIRQIYDAGHRCFGENYVQEFIDKAPQVFLSLSNPRSISQFLYFAESYRYASSRFNLMFSASGRYRVAFRGTSTEQQGQNFTRCHF